MQSPCLAIVAGAGDLPIQIVEHCKNNNITVSRRDKNCGWGQNLIGYKKNINVIGQISENIWNNKKTLQLTIRDIAL